MKNKSSKEQSRLQGSLTPTLMFESSKMSLANYKLMMKNSSNQFRGKPKPRHTGGVSLPGLPLMESIISTDTCIFPSPEKFEANDVQELKAKIKQVEEFTMNALENQKNYFEKLINDLKNERKADKQAFNKEISIARDELEALRDEKNELSMIFPENPSGWDYQTQYFKNKEFIAMLKKQNRLIYEKTMRNN